jgi:hypothetical protein
MVLEVTRAQVMAYRAAAHGLDRHAKTAADLAVLDLGVQSAGESARLAIAARLADVPSGPDDPLTDEQASRCCGRSEERRICTGGPTCRVW